MRRHERVLVVLMPRYLRVDVRDHGLQAAEIADPPGAQTRLPCRRLVLAAGALENPRLLQLSDPQGVGLGTGREHRGRFLQTHLVVRTAVVQAAAGSPLRSGYQAFHSGDAGCSRSSVLPHRCRRSANW